MMHLLNKMTQHRFSNLEISDDAVFHGPNGHDISRGASQHAFGFFAYRQDVGGTGLNGYHGGFSQDYPSIPYVNEGIGRPKINSNVIGKQAFNLRKHEFGLTEGKIK
jgi:hypothetical protein